MRRQEIPIREQGAVLVEMAFALPLLALIFLNIIDLGLIVRDYQILQNAAREGARFSSLPINQIAISSDQAATLADIREFVVNYARQERITISAGNVTVNQVYAIPGACASEISVTYTRRVLLLGAPFLPQSFLTLTGRSVFHNLYGC